MSTYGITTPKYSPDTFIDLSATEYADIARARAGVLTFVEIERKFDLLIENYADYERELFEGSLRALLFSRDTSYLRAYARGQDGSLRVTKRLVNLLTTARLYIDQVNHDLSSVYGKSSDVYGARKKAASSQFVSHVEYRFMEKLRNHVQHRAMPMWGVTYPARWEDEGLKFSMSPLLDVAKLRADDFKAPEILDELEKHGKQIRLTPVIRRYIEGLAHVHQVLAAAVEPDKTTWQFLLTATVQRGIAAFGPGIGVAIVTLDADGEVEEDLPIFTAQWEYGNEVAAKNSQLQRLSDRFISTHEKPLTST